MSVTYTYNRGSGQPKDRLRFMIPDRVMEAYTPPARFCDEELNDLYEMAGGDMSESVATACEIIAMDETKRMMSVSLSSGVSLSRSGSPAYWLQRAKTIRDLAAKVPYEFIDVMDFQVDHVGIDHTEYVDGSKGHIPASDGHNEDDDL